MLIPKGTIKKDRDDSHEMTNHSVDDNFEGLSMINIAKKATLGNVKNKKIILMNNTIRLVTKTFILYPRENPVSKNVGFILVPSSLSGNKKKYDDQLGAENILFKTGPECIETIQSIRLVS